MKTAFLIILLAVAPVQIFAQLGNLYNKDSSEVLIYNGAKIIDDQTDITKAWLESVFGTNYVEITNAILQRGISPDDVGGLQAAYEKANTDTAVVVIASRQSITTLARDTVEANAILAPRGGVVNVGYKWRIEGKVIDPGPVQWLDGNIDSVEFAPGSVDYIRPEWFGAAGDSSENDYPAFKALVSARSGTNIPIYLSDSHYLIGTRLSLESNTVIYGVGKFSTLDFIDDGSANPPNLHLAGVNNIVIKNLRIKQSNATSRTGTKGLIDIDSTTNVLVKNVIFDRSSSTALWTRASSNIHIEECQVYNTFADGFHFSRATHNVTVEKSYFSGTADDAISAVGYIDSTIQRGPNRNIKYLNNEVWNSQARGIVVMGTVGAIVSGNEIHNSQKAGILVGATMSGDSVQANRDITITKNKIYSSGLGLTSAISGIYLSYVRGFEITECRIDSAEGDGITVAFVAADGVISQNKISNADRGINIAQTASSLDRVLRDLTKSVGDVSAATIGAENIIIADNTIYRNEIDGIYVAGEASYLAKNIIIRDNIARNNNTTGGGSVYNFFLNYVDVGKISGNISLSPAAGSIVDYASANSSNVYFDDNYPVSVTYNSSVYGSLFYGAATFTVSAANTWYEMTGTTTGPKNNVTVTSDSLIVGDDGVYMLTLSVTGTGVNANETIEFGIAVDGVDPGTDAKVQEEMATANVYKPSSVQVYKVLSSGDSVYAMYRNITGTGSIAIRGAVLTLHKID